MIERYVCLFSLVLIIMMLANQALSSYKTNFVFPEFPYKDTNKNEVMFREFESACEQNPNCSNLKGLARVKCVRECISPSCYYQIYYQDELEEGEIDVRLNSFKGCFIRNNGRHR
ncbi:uncharacterized protein LOC111048209 [Nilaparvata lugens]|uniref:uncharacterized protein LOC111048209 n=1 Tax=Nilaparvata lugens TaxID=108931 RepID=UPI000B97D0F9|nr:uncharacterized protein LOC111048209 [Nilaparvata lugens]